MNYELNLAERIDIFNSGVQILQKVGLSTLEVVWASMETSATINK